MICGDGLRDQNKRFSVKVINFDVKKVKSPPKKKNAAWKKGCGRGRETINLFYLALVTPVIHLPADVVSYQYL